MGSPVPATAAQLASVEGGVSAVRSLLETLARELVERDAARERALAALAAEVVDLRRQLTTGKANEWLSVRACARRFDVSREEVARRIAAGDLVVRPWRGRGGHDAHQVHVNSARAVFGATAVPA